ncbi:MAG: hypothetical protein HY661_16925 [Betaproteobacteria bacterium]|nr:hypothetical protein [Betaproteobacteria bacterium]
MKTLQTATSDQKLHQVAAEVETRIKALFGRCPELAGFAVQDLAGVSDEVNPSDDGRKLFVTDIGFSAMICQDDLEEAYNLIGTAISDVVAEEPEAFDLLRGRTFARTLH